MRRPGWLAGSLCLLTTLIIRVGGKLVCQVFFGGKWLVGCGLWGFWRVEGVDRKNSCQLQVARCQLMKKPGAEALLALGIIRGAEAPRSLPKDRSKSNYRSRFLSHPSEQSRSPGTPASGMTTKRRSSCARYPLIAVKMR